MLWTRNRRRPVDPPVTFWQKMSMRPEVSQLYLVQLGGKSGFIDGKGRLVIPARYDISGNFHEGCAVVADLDPERRIDPATRLVRRKAGLISVTGEQVVPLLY